MSTTCTPTSRCTPGRRPRSPGAQPAAPPQRRRRRLGARVTARGARCRRRSPRRPAARSPPARRPGHARRAARARCGQDRAELAAVQRGGVRLIIQPEPADVHGRGVLEELFPGRVLGTSALMPLTSARMCASLNSSAITYRQSGKPGSPPIWVLLAGILLSRAFRAAHQRLDRLRHGFGVLRLGGEQLFGEVVGAGDELPGLG